MDNMNIFNKTDARCNSMSKMILFDNTDVCPDWVDNDLPNIYKGLIIDFNTEQPFLFNADIEFPEFFESSWLENDLNLRILHDIDNAIVSPLGIADLEDTTNIFSIMDISSGAKALMLCNMLDNVVIWGPLFGDNCTDILLEICSSKSIKLVEEHLLNFNSEKFKGYSIVKSRPYDNYKEYVQECLRELIR